MSEQIIRGDRVQCVDCDGQHKGTVVHVAGLWYGVAWDDRNPNFGRPGNTEPQYPAHFLKEHQAHLTMVGDLAVDKIA
jgi:hypothetical protein